MIPREAFGSANSSILQILLVCLAEFSQMISEGETEKTSDTHCVSLTSKHLNEEIYRNLEVDFVLSAYYSLHSRPVKLIRPQSQKSPKEESLYEA